ncbi:Ribosome-binding factor A [compost metagenome]
MPSINNNRQGRIDEEFRKEISTIINYNLNNSNVTGMISVTRVKVTPDLKYAKVSVSILNSKNIKTTLAGLKSSAGFIRSELAKKINLRNTPELVFELDESLEYGARIDSILSDIMKDIKKEDEE